VTTLVRVEPVQGAKRRAWVGPVAVAGGLLGAAAYVAARAPGSGSGIPCPFHRLTGLWCPGCGLTRGTRALLHGHVQQALGYNLFLPVVVGLAVWGWVAWFWPSVGGRQLPSPARAPKAMWTSLVIALLVFGVVRNLPFAAALAP
jgi:hypothetical protein